jgi:HEAT repeat protein
MLSFLKNLRIERISFWIGFAAASLFWWLLRLLSPRLSSAWEKVRKKLRTAQRGLRSNITQRHRSDTLKHAQGLHLAAPLFALDEILVPPRLLAPPPVLPPGESPPTEDIVDKAIPYMPNCPQIASIYGAHTLSVDEALRGGMNIAVVGPPGSGKTVALADLASRVILGKTELDDLQDRVPILVHAADLHLPPEDPEDILQPIAEAVAIYSSALSRPRLPRFIQSLFTSGRALLLLDGLDELSPEALEETVAYLGDLDENYGQTRMVVSADADQIDGLPALDFISLAVAWWQRNQQADFLNQWAQMWMETIDPEIEKVQEDRPSIHPLLINNWVLPQAGVLSPFELTLQIWAAYAGDGRGPRGSDALEAYLRRMTTESSKARTALERFAAQAITAMQPSFTPREARQWAGEILPEVGAPLPEDQDEEEQQDSDQEEITVPRVIPDLLQSGILTRRTREQLGFSHPLIMAYLASNGLGDEFFSQPYWPLKRMAAHYVAQQRDVSAYIHELLNQNHDPLYLGPWRASLLLSDIPMEAPWRKLILSQLANKLQDESIPLANRTRILTGLALTKANDIATLFRHLMKSAKPSVRRMAALASGVQGDIQAVDQLGALLHDETLIGGSACLALVNIGTQPALEAVARALLEGSEPLRRAAAEALANHVEEGYPILREGSAVDDLLVRRAVIFGLRRIGEPWTVEVLEQIQIEDAQWVVKNAAAQAFEELMQPDPHIPKPLPPLSETPWLITFAGERDVGISSGKAAEDMLVRVLKEGEPEEKVTALIEIRRRGITDIFPAIYHIIYGQEDPDVHEEAITTLWHLHAIGAKIPQPTQFGLG